MAIICNTTLSTRHFTYDPDKRWFIAEASDLRDAPDISRVYDDACDEGFFLESQRTERRILFVFHEAKCDADNDVTAWIFKPVHGHDPQFEVHILND